MHRRRKSGGMELLLVGQEAGSGIAPRISTDTTVYPSSTGEVKIVLPGGRVGAAGGRALRVAGGILVAKVRKSR
jgi:hypothetical protein